MNDFMGSPEHRGPSVEHRGPDDERLDEIFRAYRVACEPREISPNFMPELWQKIDRVQNSMFSFRRIARGFVSAAAALSLVLATIAYPPAPDVSPVCNTAYVEALAAPSDAPSVAITRPALF